MCAPVSCFAAFRPRHRRRPHQVLSTSALASVAANPYTFSVLQNSPSIPTNTYASALLSPLQLETEAVTRDPAPIPEFEFGLNTLSNPWSASASQTSFDQAQQGGNDREEARGAFGQGVDWLEEYESFEMGI